mmetsp:Transcript_88464/g.249326  ORF Transcript_88464/g.249326 Transcript_88464/m.249326 type:complete len:261 (-) Transcript_88464:497-1279(-)
MGVLQRQQGIFGVVFRRRRRHDHDLRVVAGDHDGFPSRRLVELDWSTRGAADPCKRNMYARPVQEELVRPRQDFLHDGGPVYPDEDGFECVRCKPAPIEAGEISFDLDRDHLLPSWGGYKGARHPLFVIALALKGCSKDVHIWQKQHRREHSQRKLELLAPVTEVGDGVPPDASRGVGRGDATLTSMAAAARRIIDDDPEIGVRVGGGTRAVRVEPHPGVQGIARNSTLRSWENVPASRHVELARVTVQRRCTRHQLVAA